MKAINIEKALKVYEEIKSYKGESNVPYKVQRMLDEYHAVKEKVNEAIKKAEGKASARTINVVHIFNAVNWLEYKLDIPKKYIVGVKATINVHAQNFPSAYKHIPMTTVFDVERKSSGWVVTSIDRRTCGTKEFIVTLTEDAEREIVNKYRSF